MTSLLVACNAQCMTGTHYLHRSISSCVRKGIKKLKKREGIKEDIDACMYLYEYVDVDKNKLVYVYRTHTHTCQWP